MGLLDTLAENSPAGIILGTIGKVLDRIIPDKAQQAQAAMEVLKMQQNGELAELDAQLKTSVGQLDVNKAEAASGSAYAAGWRPTVGYICALALGWNFVGVPIANYVIALHAPGTPLPPVLDFGPMLTVLLGMLGLGGLRTVEKIKGAAA